MSVTIDEGQFTINGATVPYVRQEGTKFFFWNVDASTEGKKRAEHYVATIPGFSIEARTLVYDRSKGSPSRPQPVNLQKKAQAIGVVQRDGSTIEVRDSDDDTSDDKSAAAVSPPWARKTWDGKPVHDHRGHQIGGRTPAGPASETRAYSPPWAGATPPSDAPTESDPANAVLNPPWAIVMPDAQKRKARGKREDGFRTAGQMGLIPTHSFR